MTDVVHGRRQESVKVPDGFGRDAGKIFHITEWAARRADQWAIRAMLAYNRGGGDLGEVGPLQSRTGRCGGVDGSYAPEGRKSSTVVLRQTAPGRRMVGGKPGWFGLSGRAWVSRHRPLRGPWGRPSRKLPV